ncbi:MAG: ribosomal RNA small subunit methyltransferase A [Proteobacteria bacterium]|nr:ribosomal RNA small subunit methyltransferase A [Pseudomonadota bacterium]
MSEELHPAVLLRALEQRARKRFGQHFLARPSIVSRIVRGARVSEGDSVLEIGPGLGVLTRELMRTGASVTAVELDRDLAAFLREREPDLRLIEGDAMVVDLDEAIPDPPAKVVANLPYNVGTQLVLRLIDEPAKVSSITVMLQKEVVQRMLAEPGNRTYGALTVQIAVRGQASWVLGVPPEAFHPPPKVDSAVVRIDLYEAPRTGAVTPEQFDRVVRACFTQRRKTLINSLSTMIGKERARAAAERAELPERIRGEALDVEAFVRLAEAVYAISAEQGDEA